MRVCVCVNENCEIQQKERRNMSRMPTEHELLQAMVALNLRHHLYSMYLRISRGNGLNGKELERMEKEGRKDGSSREGRRKRNRERL